MDKILLTGKTGLFTEEALRYIAETYTVLMTGKNAAAADKNNADRIRVFPAGPGDSEFARVFELGQIRAVWHVCGCVDGGRASDERNQLETVLRLSAESGVERLIVLTESTDPTDYRALLGEWSSPQGRDGGVEIAVARLPLLADSGTGRGRLDRIFAAMQQNRAIRLDSAGVSRISLLPVMELTALLLRMSSETWFHPGIYSADGSPGSLESFAELLQSLRPDAQILTAPAENEGKSGKSASSREVLRCRIPVTGAEVCDGNLTELYRLPVSFNWNNAIASQYSRALERTPGGSSGFRKTSAYLRRFSRILVPVLDLAVIFLVAEWLSRITSESVYFKIVDVRLLYVVLMGMIHGIGGGLVAAFMECVVLVARYSQIGISGLLLFYNVENWIPFVYYVAAGVICGYNCRKKEQEMRAVTAENDLIRKKYLFLNEAYRSSLSDRSELRAQILSEEDSYARVYGAVQRMKQRTPEAVCVEAVDVLRSLLENETISVYQLDPYGKKAEILSCCRENAIRPFLDPAQCPELMRVIEQGQVWKNTRFLDDVPMYASMVKYARSMQTGKNSLREISLIVTVEQAGQNQQNNWYLDHFSILCGFMQDALEAASMRERKLS